MFTKISVFYPVRSPLDISTVQMTNLVEPDFLVELSRLAEEEDEDSIDLLFKLIDHLVQ